MGHRGRVTLVNDSADITELFTELLVERQRFEVAQLSGEGTTVEEILSSAPDLVIMDFHFDEQASGRELLRRLRDGNGTATVPVILCTGDRQVTRDGADVLDSISGVHILEKPFNLEAFEALVDDVVSRGAETASA